LQLLVTLGSMSLLAAVVAIAWQHRRYLRARRDLVRDLQPLFHSSDAFHVLTFLQVEDGADVIEEVAKLRGQLETAARVVYAGKVALNGLQSSQLGDVPWSAVVLVQYPTRAAYDAVAADEGYRQALSGFARTYSHGLVRSAARNLLIPIALLGERVRQIATRAPSHFPFSPRPRDELPEEIERFAALLRERELGERAVLVVNLLKGGTPDQRAADRAYGRLMFGSMAEGGHGPMHMGRAVQLEDGGDFDRIALVYYPGVDYFAAMVRSEFYQGIVGDKQLGDTQASITVPLP